MIRFPLPYASVCSCYYGLIGKCYDVVSVHKKREPILFRNNHSFLQKYPVKQVGLVMPYSSIYTSDIMYRLHVQTIFENYIEKIEIEQVMKRNDYLNLNDDNIDKYIYHVFVNVIDKNTLLSREYRWKTKEDIHHLVL